MQRQRRTMTTCRCTAPGAASSPGWDCQPDPGAARAGRRSSASDMSTAAASAWLRWSRRRCRHRHGSPANGRRSSRRHGCSRPPQGSTSPTKGCVTDCAKTWPSSGPASRPSHRHDGTATPPVTSVAPSGAGSTSVDFVPVLACPVAAVKDRGRSVPVVEVLPYQGLVLGLARCRQRQVLRSRTSPLASSERLSPAEGPCAALRCTQSC